MPPTFGIFGQSLGIGVVAWRIKEEGVLSVEQKKGHISVIIKNNMKIEGFIIFLKEISASWRLLLFCYGRGDNVFFKRGIIFEQTVRL